MDRARRLPGLAPPAARLLLRDDVGRLLACVTSVNMRRAEVAADGASLAADPAALWSPPTRAPVDRVPEALADLSAVPFVEGASADGAALVAIPAGRCLAELARNAWLAAAIAGGAGGFRLEGRI